MMGSKTLKPKKTLLRMLVHDWPVILLLLLNLGAIGLYLGVGPTTLEGSGYRVIDIDAVRRLMDAGELSRHEAQWYKPGEATDSDN